MSAFCLAACLGTGECLAGNEPQLEEIVVSGERLTRTLSDTASSVMAVTGEGLELLSGADRIEQVLALAPNVHMGSGSEGPAIRGQDSTGVLRDLPGFLGGARPRATLQVDGRAVSFNEFIFGAAPLWDVRQVEVYRSPQTTTQGRNSIAGAMFVETHDPTYEWEGSARLIAGNYDTRQGSLVLSGPLVGEQLALRLAGDVRGSRTSSELTDLLGDADPNRDEYALVRAKLLFEPKGIPGLRVLTTYVHTESDMPQIEGVVTPFEERQDPLPTYGVFSTSVDSVTAVVRHVFSDTLESSTTLSWGDAHVVRAALPGLGETDTNSNDLSLESLLNWKPANSLRLQGGLYLLRTELEQNIDLTAVLGIGAFSDEQQSVGVFGEAEYQISPALSLTAGLRYERDSQRRLGSIVGPGVTLPIDFDGDFEAWLPNVVLAYETETGTRLGLLVQRAFNPGGTSLNFDTGQEVVFDAETLWDYELFLRAPFGGGRGLLSANLFYNGFTDAQRAQTRAFTVPGGATAFWAEIINVPESRSLGLEAEVSWRAGSLQLRAGVGLLDTLIVKTADPDDPLLDNEFARAPRITASAGVEWRPTVHWNVSVQAHYNDIYFTNDANTPALRAGPAMVVDLRTAWELEDWSVFGYVRNLFDDFYMTTLYSPERGTAGDPREYGFGVEVKF